MEAADPQSNRFDNDRGVSRIANENRSWSGKKAPASPGPSCFWPHRHITLARVRERVAQHPPGCAPGEGAGARSWATAFRQPGETAGEYRYLGLYPPSLLRI